MSTRFTRVTDGSTFRKIAAAMWRRPADPTIYGSMDIDVTEARRFIERYRAQTGLRLTITHVVARAVAQALARYPELNRKVRFWGRVEQRESVDLFVSVASEGGKDLSGVRIEAADRLPLDELLRALERGAGAIRGGADRSYQKSRHLLGWLPWWLVRPLLWMTDLLTNELNLHLPSVGMPRDPFGSAVVTNVGSFGIDTAFAPFLPLGRSAMLVLVSEIRDRPFVVGDRVEVRPVLRLCGTFDHRIIDGFSAGRLASAIREHIEHPGELPSPIEAAAPANAVAALAT